MKKYIGLIISLVLVICVMVMIFCFSSQNAEQSSNTSGVITDAVIDITYPNYDEMDENEQVVIEENVSHVVRKLAHFSEFALLGFTMALHLFFVRNHVIDKSKRFGVFLIPLLAVTFGVLYACSDEFHQGFVDGRGPGFIDVMIDSSGVVAGTILMCLILLLLNRRHIFFKKT
ncbi:MAG: VanZ family protein [Clostridia bacterium]|nr:VanZ family protein [Clostridia bacterium]